MESDIGFQAALEEAKAGFSEGGVPIGAALVAADGTTILGRGHNMRMQKGSPTLHGEISALENAGRLPASSYKGATMYTTLSPCDMCTGNQYHIQWRPQNTNSHAVKVHVSCTR